MRHWVHSLFFLLFFALAAMPSHAQPALMLSNARLNGPVHRFQPAAPNLTAPSDPGRQCRAAVIAAGREGRIPDHVMSAIARVESGRRGADGSVQPWPWSINVEGADHVYDTKAEAIAAVRQFQAQGARSIDVGCMQVNLLHHPTAFASLEQAFDPGTNARYAARFLNELFAQSHAWPKAIADYHSATPALGEAYAKQVLTVLAEETQADLHLAGIAPAGSPLGVGAGLAQRGALPGGASIASPAGPPALTAAPAGAIMLGNHSEAARVQPGLAIGRGLDAYRAAPVRLAGR